MDLREFHAYEFRIFEKLLLMLSRQRTQTLLNQIQLIQIILSCKKWFSIDSLRHNTSNRPNINRFIIIIPPNQQLRRPIPSRRHVISHNIIMRHSSSKTKVTDLNRPRFPYQHVLWFDISMDHIYMMHISYTFEHVVCIMFDRLRHHRSLL